MFNQLKNLVDSFFFGESLNFNMAEEVWENQTRLPNNLEDAGINIGLFFGINAIIAILTCAGNILVLVAYAVTPKLRQHNKVKYTYLITFIN